MALHRSLIMPLFVAALLLASLFCGEAYGVVCEHACCLAARDSRFLGRVARAFVAALSSDAQSVAEPATADPTVARPAPRLPALLSPRPVCLLI